jgi:hypothetical protein
LPPLWFHFVASLTPNVGASFWTDSLFSDVWCLLTNASRTGSGGNTAGSTTTPDHRSPWRPSQWRGLLDGVVVPPDQSDLGVVAATARRGAGGGKQPLASTAVRRTVTAARALLHALFMELVSSTNNAPQPPQHAGPGADSRTTGAAAVVGQVHVAARERLAALARDLLGSRYGCSGAGRFATTTTSGETSSSCTSFWDGELPAFRTAQVAEVSRLSRLIFQASCCECLHALASGGDWVAPCPPVSV